jgi:hypothetical protein
LAIALRLYTCTCCHGRSCSSIAKLVKQSDIGEKNTKKKKRRMIELTATGNRANSPVHKVGVAALLSAEQASNNAFCRSM